MSLSKGSVIQWSDIRSLFNRVNAERARWSFSTVTAPTRTVIDIDELVTIKDLLQDMTSNSFLSSAASTNGITLTAKTLAKAQTPISLSNIIAAVEEVRPQYTGFNAFNEGTFGQGFQYTGTFGQGFEHSGTFGIGFQFESHEPGGPYFDSYGRGDFCKLYGVGGDFSQKLFCSEYSILWGEERPASGSPIFTGHKDISCSTFTFTSSTKFCKQGTFTNGCAAPHQGFLSGFDNFTPSHFDFEGGHDSCGAVGLFSTRFGFVFDGTFGHGFVFDGTFGEGFKFESHEPGGTYFDSHGDGGAYFDSHGDGGAYFSNHGTGGGTYFNAHNVAGFCSSHNSASFFASL